MIQNIYPLFERNRIMKKELLWALRNYSFGFMQLEYQKYANGILEGLDIDVTENEIHIGRGLIKFNDFIFLLTEKQIVPYEPTERLAGLKLKISGEKTSEDYIIYQAAPILDETLELKEDEIEVCRFKLKAGSRLRNNYVGFFDIETEFDTINLAHSTWAGIGKPSLSPAITTYYAKAAMQCVLENPRDMIFCSLCLNSTKAITREIVEAYIRASLELEELEFTNQQMFEFLELMLRNIQNGTQLRPARKIKKRRQIIVD